MYVPKRFFLYYNLYTNIIYYIQDDDFSNPRRNFFLLMIKYLHTKHEIAILFLFINEKVLLTK